MKIIGIYKIQSRLHPSRIYIGSSVDITYRWNQHLTRLRNNDHHSSKLQNHYNKYKESDLVFSIILTCEKESLRELEQYFLDSQKCYFNIKLKATCNYDKKTTEEVNIKRSLKMRGIPKSEETKKKMSKAQLGNSKGLGKKRKFSLIHRKRISEAKKNISEETRRKYKEAQLGPKNHNYGKPKSEETRKRNSESGKLGWIKRKLKQSA